MNAAGYGYLILMPGVARHIGKSAYFCVGVLAVFHLSFEVDVALMNEGGLSAITSLPTVFRYDRGNVKPPELGVVHSFLAGFWSASQVRLWWFINFIIRWYRLSVYPYLTLFEALQMTQHDSTCLAVIRTLAEVFGKAALWETTTSYKFPMFANALDKRLTTLRAYTEFRVQGSSASFLFTG